MSSSKVCFGFAQAGSCLSGSECKFAHIDVNDFNISRHSKKSMIKDKHSKIAQAHIEFKDTLVQQFNNYYGTDADDLNSWRHLCEVVHISPIPKTLRACRKAVKNTFVNIVDLVETKMTGKPVKVFATEVELSEYTNVTGKYFPNDNPHAGDLLKYLLRQIINPRAENPKMQKKHE